MIRVLHIFYEMYNGGIEHFVMDYYRHIDRLKVQFDFLVSVDKEGYFDDEIKSLGGTIYRAYPLKKNPIKNYLDIARIVKENNYDIVHRHTGSAFAKFDLLAAKHGGAKQLILHSHNNQAGNKILHYISNRVFRVDCKKLACSTEAGEWLFGKKSDFSIVSNAIDCEHFKYNEDIRKEVRTELGIENEFVIGHVGRFEDQKNHEFLIDIFKEVLYEKSNSTLICIGTGSKLESIKQKAKDLGFLDKIKFLGMRDDINRFMQAFDVFVLPSKYEGFGITLLEAQANGLYCFTSLGVVTNEVNVCKTVRFLSLNDITAKQWAREIIKVESRARIKENTIEKAGFDINENVKKLCNYYESL